MSGKTKTDENVSPGTVIPLVVSAAGKATKKLNLYLENVTWGMIPSYHAKDVPTSHFDLINNRVEQLFAADGYFKKLANSVENRAIFVITGYYEWKVVARKKTPHYIYLADGQSMNIAMLVDK